ncbi:bifunctional phosphopantothenoylcysteine decarboxylase/phosphopantothenate--cysteine ligase CoaBC [Acetobacter peroxydans]|jgi:phosphopantothenoylcysteine decarboxylase/phosphopantothenate--cysteine ligase|uniref:bifunctional phosphopantothenoylcysteine decarboxylase/phosphopantothenate--cysteine ligase CoaBC n=1 Tax=Acetobacter peroxydans TaxID=104098 RepID=UPI0023536182|nr:bifunctional phosphopantothenoylcysteine decarboxylase/phosphopantothenate--cysteine ligase CoaBC [Acetobacter peroxydans]MCH4142735.1 bifunctional phosphopantothenoylcysteine decarboxylase/phosphopantothenate--cysteine ligase CoaBC [Acetobacter peroxydans]MCI1395728.1 bifunctional phosphopantothenoylcysteine decarboxylase/phosphopantothenate--cysteine ligase CoaBC [Acetobacter peroxydans]MCI1411021.1 bifunctional phosphopantothenoylcysteine decarboxylase/phosphopantothenate--cysteine ligase 
MARPDTPRSVLLVISGSIAAYKAPELIRLLQAEGIRVRCVLTRGGSQFVTPLTLQALTGAVVAQDLFSLTEEQEMGHIALSRWADLVLVCPASANLLARMAGGLAEDLASTLLLATDALVMVAPAMNVRMWEHPATRQNMAVLAARGVEILPPDTGEMACGEFGAGRLPSPAAIRDAVLTFFLRREQETGPLAGLRALVTAGPTHEPLDPVRYLANRSSGRQGYAIAQALAELGADVTLVSGPVTLAAPVGVHLVRCETAQEMQAHVMQALPCDVAVCTAAVADWRPETEASQKIKKTGDMRPPALSLVPNPDILAQLCALASGRPGLVIGFAAETETVQAHAQAKRQRKGCDWLVANDVSPHTGIMGGEHNEVMLITPDGMETWPRMSKQDVAEKLAARVGGWWHDVQSAGCG